MRNWAAHALDALENGEPCALISLLAVEGSTPREAGTRMVVMASKTFGTIGGGNLEFRAIEQARAVLNHPQGRWAIQDYPLGPFLNQCCGGRVRLMVEHLDLAQKDWLSVAQNHQPFGLETRLFEDHVERQVAEVEAAPLSAKGIKPVAGERLTEQVGQPRTPLLMFGAGHVGQALARVLEGLPFALSWFDTRIESAEVAGVTTAEPAVLIAEAHAAKGLVLILTHDHTLDYELTKAALKSEATFIGLIGSATKKARFMSRLAKDGFDDAVLARIHCPIGIPGISGKAPEVIAVSVAAQLLLKA